MAEVAGVKLGDTTVKSCIPHILITCQLNKTKQHKTQNIFMSQDSPCSSPVCFGMLAHMAMLHGTACNTQIWKAWEPRGEQSSQRTVGIPGSLPNKLRNPRKCIFKVSWHSSKSSRRILWKRERFLCCISKTLPRDASKLSAAKTIQVCWWAVRPWNPWSLQCQKIYMLHLAVLQIVLFYPISVM